MKIIITIVITTLVISACGKKSPEKAEAVLPQDNVIADTITYDVLIMNPNPDDEWTEACLQNLDKETFIDQVFTSIYNGDLEPIDYYDDEPLKLRKLKQLEEDKEIDRDAIGKVQFTERWFFDPVEMKMKKEVISMVLGEQLYSGNGDVRGYKPLFKINLK